MFKKSIKLGVSYNVFDGEELLEASIRSIREEVDHINIVYQTTSNFGEPCSKNLIEVINNLHSKKLVDSTIKFTPSINKGPHWNEILKRNIGLKNIQKLKCSHFMTMDTDEFYNVDQFKVAKNFIRRNRIISTAAKMYYYIKEPIYQLQGFRKTYVPFIVKITPFSYYKWNTYFPVLVDPTRGLHGNKKFHLFDEDDLVMHHMSFVRRDLSKKFNNSSCNISSNEKKWTKEYNNVKDWSFGEDFHWIGEKHFKVIEVSNQFNIEI